MAQKNLVNKGLPAEVASVLTTLGRSISIARKRRSLTMEEMAARMFITRKTLSRLEKGDPGVSIGVVASALWVLGLEGDLKNIASPGQDKIGLFHEQKNMPLRVRKAPQDDLDF